MELAGKHAVVVGMGKSGQGAARLLRTKGAHVRALDDKATGEIDGVAVEPQTENSFSHADLVVVSPGVPADLPVLEKARTRGIAVIGEFELASWFLQGPLIGITGSNGKTTTTSLTGHVLRECGVAGQVGGNIGTAPTAMIETSRPDQWNVLELSSFQLETAFTFHAQLAACLNVTQNHLDRHHSFENYAAAKARLLEMQKPGDTAVLNASDPVTASFAKRTPATVRWFSSSESIANGACLRGEQILLDGEPLVAVHDLPLRGRHNWENVMAAALLAVAAGAERGRIAGAVQTFQPVEHRLEFVRKLSGVSYYNDSKATSVDATLKAIGAFASGLWIILGGKDKDSDFTVLREPLRERAHSALLIGSAAGKLQRQLQGAVPLEQCGTLSAAIQYAWAHATAGDTVLLAPACASFDQFSNFEHRGQVFKQLVSELQERA